MLVNMYEEFGQVFDSLSSALKCIHYMEANNSYSLSPNEDVTVLNLRSKP